MKDSLVHHTGGRNWYEELSSSDTKQEFTLGEREWVEGRNHKIEKLLTCWSFG